MARYSKSGKRVYKKTKTRGKRRKLSQGQFMKKVQNDPAMRSYRKKRNELERKLSSLTRTYKPLVKKVSKKVSKKLK